MSGSDWLTATPILPVSIYLAHFLGVYYMAVNKSLASSSLAEVIDRILDKGLVVDAFVRIALVGIELISIEIRVVIASVETYLRYAEAVGLTSDPIAST